MANAFLPSRRALVASLGAGALLAPSARAAIGPQIGRAHV